MNSKELICFKYLNHFQDALRLESRTNFKLTIRTLTTMWITKLINGKTPEQSASWAAGFIEETIGKELCPSDEPPAVLRTKFET